MRRIWAFLAFVLVVAMPAWAQAKTVADYIDMARDKERDADYDAAIAIYNAIIEQFPDKFADVYAARGEDLVQVGNYKAAIADLDKALALNAADPKSSGLDRRDALNALDERAKAKNYSNDPDGAIADYTQLIALDPKDGYHYGDRADVKLGKGDCAGAVADYSSALQLVEKQSSLQYEGRAAGRICVGDLAGALEDYRRNFALEDELDGQTHMQVIHRSALNYWTVAALLGRKAEAEAVLSAKLAATPKPADTDFEYDAARFFLGQTDDSPLLRDADASKAKQPKYAELYDGDVLYFSALKQLALGNATVARADFDKILKFHRHYAGAVEHVHAWLKVVDRMAAPKAPSQPAEAGAALFSRSVPVKGLGGGDLGGALRALGMTLTAPLDQPVVLIDQKDIYGGAAIAATHGKNVLLQSGGHPCEYTLAFLEGPRGSISFNRSKLKAGPSGVSHPVWKATAFDANGRVLSTVSEAEIRSMTDVPAQRFTLNGPGISRVTFWGDDKAFDGFCNVVIDSLDIQK